LDAFADLSICTSYKIDGKATDQIPFQMTWNKIEPQYQNFKGWNKDITKIKEEAELPEEMQQYVQFINKSLGAPIRYISNGPGRDQIVEIKS
jgi:adenylosuccinate synthase